MWLLLKAQRRCVLVWMMDNVCAQQIEGCANLGMTALH